MGFTTSNLSLYHTFSKTPVDSNVNSAAAQLGNAINKSGHTVQSNEIWTESIPFFGLAATTTAIHNKFSATAKVNDLVKDSDGKIWQRNSTVYSTSATFDNLWSEKTKSITSFSKGTDGKYTFTEADGALVDGSYLLNSEGVPTVKYYEKRLLTRLTADNNANTNSDNKASRLQIDGKWIDQFIGVTDIYLNGSAAVSYAPVLRKTASSSPMQSGPGKAYMDYCATGLILWESSAAGTEVIDCFEYVGTKLDATVAKLSAAVFGSNNGGSDQPVDLVTQVNLNTTAIATLNGDADETGSVANQIASATSTLASKSEITINDIKVKVGSGTATSLVPDNKSVTIEIPDAPEAVVTTEGTVTTDGFTKTAAVTSLANAAITTSLAGTTAGTIGKAISDADAKAQQGIDDAADALAKANEVDGKLTPISETITAVQAIADAKVASVTGPTSGLITVSGDKTVTITVSDTIATKSDAATAASTAITTSLTDTTTDGTIGKAIAAVATTANNAVKTVSKSGSSTLLTVTQTGTAVTVSLSDTVATKSDITTEINKLTAADGAITALDGRVDDIETSLADGGTIHELIDTAQAAADAKVADVTVDGTSVVTGAAGSKTVALTTTKGVEITPSADSASTALATEASVAKALASITSVGVSYEVIPDGQTHANITTPVKGRIYLEKDTTNAEAGIYIEWFYTGTDWEKIGSTKTDHSTYASTITVNGSPKTVANSAVDLGAFASSVTAGNGVASGSVSATGALSLTLTTASTTAVGITQLTDVYTETEDSKAATGKSIAAAIATLDSSESVNGITVTQVDGKITELSETLITASVPANTTKVEGNIAYVGSTKHVIAPEKFETAAQMPATLTSWVADLSNLTVGDNMFKGCTKLTTFVGDLSSLTSGVDMFNGCILDDESFEILAENLPVVTGSPTITIGIGSMVVSFLNEIKAVIEAKGWTAIIIPSTLVETN